MIRTNNFDYGTNNTGMTTGNTGGANGDAFSAVTVDAVFSDEQSHAGGMSMKTPSGSPAGYGRWVVSGDRTAALRQYVYCTSNHSADYGIFNVYVNTAAAASVYFNAVSRLRLRSNIDAATLWTAANAFPLNQWVRTELTVEIGTTNSDGRARFVYYAGESLTPIEDSGWIENANLGGNTGTIDNVRFGKSGTGTYPGSLYIDSIALRTGSDYTGLIGPLSAPPAPVANAGLHQTVLTGSTVNLNGSASTDATSYAWSFIYPSSGAPTLTGANTATPSFTAGTAGSIYALQLTVSNGSQDDTAIVHIATGSPSPRTDLVWSGTEWV